MDDTSIRILHHAAQGLCCSQILIQLALEDMGEENVPLVRAMAGLCNGVGIGSICGAASGGACVLALYGAAGGSQDEALECYPLMLAEFMEWFQQTGPLRWGGITCDEIMGEGQGGKELESCGAIIVDVRNRILEILTAHGLDPSSPRG
jgi:hypothetical protein